MIDEFTAWILANKNSNIRGVIPRCGLGFTSKSSISPSIVYVFPLPVYKINGLIHHLTFTKMKYHQLLSISNYLQNTRAYNHSTNGIDCTLANFAINDSMLT